MSACISPFLRGLGRNRRSPHVIRKYFCPVDLATRKEVIAVPLLHTPLFPGISMPIYVKDPKILAALEENIRRQGPYAGAFLVKDEDMYDAVNKIYYLRGKDLLSCLHQVGTLAEIRRIKGGEFVLTGHGRLQIAEMVSEDPLTVKVEHLKEKPYDKDDDDILTATRFALLSSLRDILEKRPIWRDHMRTCMKRIGDLTYSRLADFSGAVIGGNKLQCQRVLEELDVHKRLNLTLKLAKKEMDISQIQESTTKDIKAKISWRHRLHSLNEQLKAVKKERGSETDDKTALFAMLRERLDPKKEKIPPHVMKVIEEELTKLQSLEASSSEFNVTHDYLDWLTVLPWGEYSEDNIDGILSQRLLDECYYYVKKTVWEIALGGFRGTYRGKIVCLSGPPGVGKKTICRFIARSLNRKFYQFSVGWLSDVAEIKGHRRPYIGAMPGKMVQCLKSVGTSNPVVMIDDIDKSLARSDHASVMLELLDPEQNANFLDHFLDVPIDLSKVLFVCTATDEEMIPKPLLDRMEVISIGEHVTDEEMHLEKITQEKRGSPFCFRCGGPVLQLPIGVDAKPVCTRCGLVIPMRPKAVVGCIMKHENKILLYKKKGEKLWALPYGFLQCGETLAEGAIGEIFKAGLVKPINIIANSVVHCPARSEVYFMMEGSLDDDCPFPDLEADKCSLFSLDEMRRLPLDPMTYAIYDMVFRSHYQSRGDGEFSYFPIPMEYNIIVRPIGERPEIVYDV